MRILVAEDNADNLELMVRYLRRRGHEVLTAATGLEAVERTLSERPDLVLMDVSLPQMSGIEATKRIRSDTPIASTPIVAVTAHAMDGDRARCLEAGCSSYVSKPIDYAALDALIASLARKH
jgi:CheY-like chemotaxis protein